MKHVRRYMVIARARAHSRPIPLSLTLPLLAFFAMLLGQFMVLAAEDALTLEFALPRIWQAMFLAGLLSIILSKRRL
jgi:hypothetical protein